MKKTLYEQPTTKVFVVRCGGCLCQSGFGAARYAGCDLEEDDAIDL